MIRGTNLASRLYVQQLRAQYRPGRIVYDPDFASLSDPEIWDRVRRDPVVLAAMELRTSQIVGETWRVLPAKPKDSSEAEQLFASVLEEALGCIDDFDESRGELAQAFMRGSAWAWIDWEERILSLAGEEERPWRVPVRLRDIDRYRFEQRTADDGCPAWHFHSVKHDTWEPVPAENMANLVKVVYRNTEDALGYGRGLLEAIYHFLYFRDELLAKCLDWADRVAFGTVKAKVDQLRDASTGYPNTALVEAWKNVLRELRSQHVLVYGDGDEVDVLAGPTDGARVVLDMINYFDRAITRLLVGGTLTMGVSQDDAGSLAQSETHRKSGQDLVLRDKKKVDAAITRDLIGQFRRLNAAQLGDLGLGRVKPPRFSSEQDNEDAQVAATVASTLLGAGVPLRRDELYKKVGYTPPAEGDDVVEGRPAPAPGMGGPLGFPLG